MTRSVVKISISNMSASRFQNALRIPSFMPRFRTNTAFIPEKYLLRCASTKQEHGKVTISKTKPREGQVSPVTEKGSARLTNKMSKN